MLHASCTLKLSQEEEIAFSFEVDVADAVTPKKRERSPLNVLAPIEIRKPKKASLELFDDPTAKTRRRLLDDFITDKKCEEPTPLLAFLLGDSVGLTYQDACDIMSRIANGPELVFDLTTRCSGSTAASWKVGVILEQPYSDETESVGVLSPILDQQEHRRMVVLSFETRAAHAAVYQELKETAALYHSTPSKIANALVHVASGKGMETVGLARADSLFGSLEPLVSNVDDLFNISVSSFPEEYGM